MNGDSSPNSNVSIPQNNVSAPKTNSNVLNSLLQETAASGEWKTIERDGSDVKSVQDNVEQLPDHLASALTKDYSQMLKMADQKSKVKNGA